MAWVCHVAGSLLVNLTLEAHMTACVHLDVGMPAAAWGLVGIGKSAFVTDIEIGPDRWLGCAARGVRIPPPTHFNNRF
jgi:hypothetical protein